MTTGSIEAAMVFAAGLGTRMRPITLTVPKPLVVVGGRTLLDHMLDRLAEAGVSRAVVNVHYLADQIEARCRARNGPPALTISDERDLLLDQGGGIKRALPALGQNPFLVCNTDAVWTEREPAIAAMVGAFDPRRSDVTLLLARRETSVGVDWPGDFHRAPDGRLTRRREGEVADYVYAGVGILKPTPFAETPGDVFRLAPFFFEAAAAGRLHGHVIDGRWLHVGTPEAVGEADAVLEAAPA